METNSLLLIIAIFGFIFALVRTAIAYVKWRYKVIDRKTHPADNKALYALAQIKQILEAIRDKI